MLLFGWHDWYYMGHLTQVETPFTLILLNPSGQSAHKLFESWMKKLLQPVQLSGYWLNLHLLQLLSQFPVNIKNVLKLHLESVDLNLGVNDKKTLVVPLFYIIKLTW